MKLGGIIPGMGSLWLRRSSLEGRSTSATWPGVIVIASMRRRGQRGCKTAWSSLRSIVPFLKGWMITTEMVPSWSGSKAREHVRDKYGEGISQFAFTQEYLVEHDRRTAIGSGL